MLFGSVFLKIRLILYVFFASIDQMKISYARRYTSDQSFYLHREAFARAGCTMICEEQVGEHRAARPKFEYCFNALSEGATLTVWQLDCLGRSLSDLIRMVSMLNDCGVAFEGSVHGLIRQGFPGSFCHVRG